MKKLKELTTEELMVLLRRSGKNQIIYDEIIRRCFKQPESDKDGGR